MNISGLGYNNPYISVYSNISKSSNSTAKGIDDQNSYAKNQIVPDNKNDPKLRIQKQLGIIECQTCKNRKYQDGSDDPGVSFKSPTHISPESSGSAVMAHEQEHVVRESANAERDGREVVSQNVNIHTAICPECGKSYISGGTTTTETRNKDKNDFFKDNYSKFMDKFFGKAIDLKL